MERQKTEINESQNAALACSMQSSKPDPYDLCPTYESDRFQLHLVCPDDAQDLFACYSNPDAQRFFNSDRCTNDFCYETLAQMQECIAFWLQAYADRAFVRFAIVDKATGKALGTVEIFGGTHGVLRIDVMPAYENVDHLSELLKIADHFFADFSCENQVVKAIPEAEQRTQALLQNGYAPYPASKAWPRDHYYRKGSTHHES